MILKIFRKLQPYPLTNYVTIDLGRKYYINTIQFLLFDLEEFNTFDVDIKADDVDVWKSVQKANYVYSGKDSLKTITFPYACVRFIRFRYCGHRPSIGIVKFQTYYDFNHIFSS